MANVLRIPYQLEQRDNFIFFRDFENYTTATDGLTSVLGSTGTAAVGDAENGRLVLTTAAADNDEAGVKSTNELFLVEANRSLCFEALVQYSEAATNAANVVVGFASAADATLLADNGAGPRTSGNQFLIYKVDGGTVWRCQSRNGSGVTDTISLSTAGGTAFQRLKIVVGDYDGTNVYTRFYLDGVELMQDAAGKPAPIVHKTAIASSTEMNAVVLVKSGSTTAEVLNADYLCAWQNRGDLA